jgi:hypothetical protein
VSGTNVPKLEAGNWTEQDVAGAAGYRANLGGNVWLAALAQGPTGAVSQALLVWEPITSGENQSAQSTLYHDAFQALMKTVNPSISGAQRAKVTGQLGLTRQRPPFPDTTENSAEQPPQRYDLFNVDPADPTQPGPATITSVTSL